MERFSIIVTILIYIAFIKIFIRVGAGIKRKTDSLIYTQKINNTISEDMAFSPVMYNQPIEGVAKEFINNELRQQNFTLKDSTTDLEIKKSIVSLIVTILFLIVELLFIFRISQVFSIIMGLLTAFFYGVALKKITLTGLLYKEFKAREDENMEYIISSYIQHRVPRIPISIARLAIMITILAIPFIILRTPKFFYEKVDGGYDIRFYAGVSYPDEIVIPDTYNGEPVVGIRGNVFKNIKNVKKVVLPDTIQYINGHAFENDANLKEIVLPESLNKLGAYAFNRCGIEEVNIPASLKVVSSYSFSNNTSLKKVTFNDVMDKVDSYAFENDSHLTDVVNLSVKDLGVGAFAYTALTSNIELLEGITTIPYLSFAGTNITTITIPQSVTSISESAFEDSKLEEIELPKKLEKISESAFRNTRLTSIIIPDTVTKISAHAFRECSRLSYVKLPKGITEIKASTFRNTAIKSIVIPNGVTTIGESAFRSCTYLESVSVPNTVTYIDDKAFRECSSLESIVLPYNVRLGEKVFKDSPTRIKYN